MSTLDELQSIQELDKFNIYKDYIKNFILTSENLWKIIYHSTSNPLDKEYGENPYSIFKNEKDSKHGVVLFKDKNDVILNSETVNILINFSSETSEDSDCINTIFIKYSVILKGVNIQTLADNSSRAYKICELIDEQFNHVNVTTAGKIKKVSFNNESINEENSSFKLIYKSIVSNYADTIQIYSHQQLDDEWGIARESYNLVSTTVPILVDIHRPNDEDKKTQQYHGYDLEVSRIMICDTNLGITESTIIKYNDEYYRIQKIIKYEDYWNCSLIITHNAIINT